MKNFRHKLFAVLTLIFVLLTTVAFAAETTYSVGKEFSKDKQGPTWYYEYNDGGGFKELPQYYQPYASWTFSADPPGDGVYANLWKESNNSISVHPDNNKDKTKHLQIAASWKAPADGKVTIPAGTALHKDPGAGTESITASILHNTKALWSSKIEAGKSAKFKEIVVNVKKGDMIRFLGDAKDRQGNNTLNFPGTLKFAEGEVAEKPSNPQTGDAGLGTYGILAALAVAGMVLVIRRK